MQTETEQGFDEWALVELMGHQRIAGRVTEAQIGGCKFVRVDVPEFEKTQALTKYLGPSSIYAITPVTEATARALARKIDAAPITAWDAESLVRLIKEDQPKLLDTGTTGDDENDEEEDEDHPF